MKRTLILLLALAPGISLAQYELWAGNHVYATNELPHYYSDYFLTLDNRYHKIGEGDGTCGFDLTNAYDFIVLISSGKVVNVDAVTGSDGSHYVWNKDVHCGNVQEFWRAQGAPDGKYAVMRRGHTGGAYSSFLVFSNYAGWTGITVHALSSTDLFPDVQSGQIETAMEISFPAVEGLTYRLQHAGSATGQWISSEYSIESAGGLGRLYGPADGTSGFYRAAVSGMADPGGAMANLAEQIVAAITNAANTSYYHTTFISETNDFYHTDCSGFVSYLLAEISPRHLYLITREPDHPWPRAFKYQQFFSGLATNGSLGDVSNGWNPVVHISRLQRGDVLAWMNPSLHPDTGHVMLIADSAVHSGGNEWMVPVYDSSNTEHWDDTRTVLGAHGVGYGKIKFWVNGDGEPVAHQIGPSAVSNNHPIAMGRAIALE